VNKNHNIKNKSLKSILLGSCLLGGFMGIFSQLQAGPLHSAARNGDVREIRRLLRAGTDVDERDDSGNRPLHYAGNPEVVDLFYENGANVNAAGLQGNTPLFMALVALRLEVVKQLIRNGADVNRTNNAGYSPAWVLINILLTEYICDGRVNLPIREGSYRHYLEALKLLFLPENLW
jgi:hypothetical protein